MEGLEIFEGNLPARARERKFLVHNVCA